MDQKYIFWPALIIGLMLAAAGGISMSMSLIASTTSLLILCCGLGIILGAFGSTATIKHKGAVVTGVAAISIVLLLVVD
ncbi:hypothetical protein D3874_24705 [Oleomonas cavernae]|uniref:Uncharacterized protein n=1 Tax=Oleomonas cavernae TaxID=2320859 RepID=A0A418WIA6_9PROT|nr:hypothetical protein [Oleomonas cavernae]RJF89774.1 hypothetical protein D3874_24705 [Oleomonas cavernae]